MSTAQQMSPFMSTADMDQFAKIVVETIGVATRPLHERIKLLEQQLREIEGKGIAFEGTYAPGRVYRRGSVVVRKGSSLVALEPTSQDPADATPADKSWALLAARGRDGTKGDPGRAGRDAA